MSLRCSSRTGARNYPTVAEEQLSTTGKYGALEYLGSMELIRPDSHHNVLRKTGRATAHLHSVWYFLKVKRGDYSIYGHRGTRRREDSQIRLHSIIIPVSHWDEKVLGRGVHDSWQWLLPGEGSRHHVRRATRRTGSLAESGI
jgi:hypothetical protein